MTGKADGYSGCAMAHPVEEFEEYRREVLALLGEADPLDVLSATPVRASALVLEATPELLTRSPAPGEWAVKDVLQHLVDTDLVYGYRIRMIVTSNRPLLAGYDQDVWVARFGRESEPVRLLNQWRALREANLSIYRGLSVEEMGRVGLHAERGEESVELILRLLAGHDLLHLGQMEALLA